MADKKKDGNKDKYDGNIERDGMGTVDKEGSSEESGLNPKKKKKDKPSSGEGIEEFIDQQPNLRDGEKDES
jgi:hypothetical protein